MKIGIDESVYENPHKQEDFKLMILMGFFTAFYLLANILAVKAVQIAFITVPLGVLCFPFLFLITDVTSEVYGKKTAQKMVGVGFVVMLASLALMQLAVYLRPAGFFEGFPQEAFKTILGATLRITGASMVTYLIPQYHDVWAFHFWRKITKGKHLWIRNNLSTIISQLLDSVIFITLAFVGTVSGSALWAMIWGQWLVKCVIALADTPFCYILVKWAKK
jgi:hypothetical protein